MTDFRLTFVNANGSTLLTETYKDLSSAYDRILNFAAFQRLIPNRLYKIEEIDPKLFRLIGYDGAVKVLASIIPIDTGPGLCYNPTRSGKESPMKTYCVTISYSNNGKSLVFIRHIPVFAAGKDGPAAARGAAMLAYCSEIRLPISKITGIDIYDDPFTCLADCESIKIPEKK